jgi:hypothetical protein
MDTMLHKFSSDFVKKEKFTEPNLKNLERKIGVEIFGERPQSLNTSSNLQNSRSMNDLKGNALGGANKGSLGTAGDAIIRTDSKHG